MAEEHDETRPKITESHPVLATPQVLSVLQSSRQRTITTLMSSTVLEVQLRTFGGDNGARNRIAFGTDLLQQGLAPIAWIETSPSAFFNLETLMGTSPDLRSLLQPDPAKIRKSATLQVPYCLQCRNCFQVGVYYPSQLVSHCLQCLPLLLGYAAAERFIQSVLTLHQMSVEGTSADRPVPTALSPANLRVCAEILSLLLHPLSPSSGFSCPATPTRPQTTPSESRL